VATLATRLILMAAALGATLAAHARIPVPVAAALPAPEPQQPEVTGFATFGFDALVGDYRWLQALQVVGNERADLIGAAPTIQRLIEAVVAVDPFVDHPYRFASLWLTNDIDQVRAANRMLERGIAYHPNEWRNRFYLSFNHFFYLGDVEAAARELEGAVDLPGAPRYMANLLARLRSEKDGLEAAAAYLSELLQQTDDPWKQAELGKALDEIETERRARYLDQAREVYRERHGRDIARVEDLAEGRDAVLSKLPAELHGWGWVLDPETGQIESSYLAHRYRLNMQAVDRERVEKWTGRDPLATPQEARQ
jgi:plasmid stabilization system protein ParE